MEEVDDGQQEYLFELIDYLLEWLKNHILKMDKQIPAKQIERAVAPDIIITV